MAHPSRCRKLFVNSPETLVLPRRGCCGSHIISIQRASEGSLLYFRTDCVPVPEIAPDFVH